MSDNKIVIWLMIVALLACCYIWIHDLHSQEDSSIFWNCRTQGNSRCGPGQPVIDFRPENLTRW